MLTPEQPAKVRQLSRAVCLCQAISSILFLFGCSGTFHSSPPPPPCTNCPSHVLFATGINQIIKFQIDSSTGALSSPTIASGPNQSVGIIATPTNVYVSDFLNDAVDVFSISNTGGLTAVSGSPFSLGGNSAGAGGLALAPGIGSLYATDLNRGIVTAWVSNQGVLTAISGSPFTVGNTPERVVVATTTTGNLFAYVSNTNDSAGSISAFSINLNTGALTPVPGSPFATGAAGSFPGPAAMVVREAGSNFLYVALAGTANANNEIVAFVIDANTGALTPVPGSPFTTGKDPLHMTLDAPGNFLYTSNIQDNTISAFSFDNNTGALSPVPGSPFPGGGSSLGGMSAYSGFLYVADPQGNAIRGYVVDDTSTTSTGALTAMTGSPFKAGNQPSFLSAVVSPGP